MIFDNWNVEGSSCGIVNGQTVFAGCGYTYIVEEECKKQCGAYTCVETKFNIDGWVDPASATKDGERARLLHFFFDVFSLLTYYSPISTLPSQKIVDQCHFQPALSLCRLSIVYMRLETRKCFPMGIPCSKTLIMGAHQ